MAGAGQLADSEDGGVGYMMSSALGCRGQCWLHPRGQRWGTKSEHTHTHTFPKDPATAKGLKMLFLLGKVASESVRIVQYYHMAAVKHYDLQRYNVSSAEGSLGSGVRNLGMRSKKSWLRLRAQTSSERCMMNFGYFQHEPLHKSPWKNSWCLPA